MESFNQLITRWERPIYALAYRVIGQEEDARDVVQETFLRAFRGIGAFKGQAKFSSWLYRIALNLCRDWIRRRAPRAASRSSRKTWSSRTSPPTTGPSESVEDLVARRELSGVVEAAMAKLPEEQRTAIILKEYHGMTFQEIADLQGCPLSTVKTRLYQGCPCCVAIWARRRSPCRAVRPEVAHDHDEQHRRRVASPAKRGEDCAVTPNARSAISTTSATRDERARMELHILTCEACAAELAELGGARAATGACGLLRRPRFGFRVAAERPAPVAPMRTGVVASADAGVGTGGRRGGALRVGHGRGQPRCGPWQHSRDRERSEPRCPPTRWRSWKHG